LLAKFFFLKFSNTNLLNINNYNYFKLINFEKIKDYTLKNAIKNILKNKMFNNNKINNRALLILLSHLILLFKQLF